MTAHLTFLGHSCFLLSDGETRVIIDPFLTGNPVAAMTADEVECDHIALTHGHADHFGDTIALAKKHDATVHAAFEITEYVQKQGHANVSPGNPGGRVATPFGSIAFTQAFHSSSFDGEYMGMPCGLVIEIGGATIYHAGDTGLFSDMKLIGELYSPDVAILPIGDRFTMGPEHASIAAEWIGAPTMIPCHFDTWEPIAQDPSVLAPNGVTVTVLKPGATHIVEG